MRHTRKRRGAGIMSRVFSKMKSLTPAGRRKALEKKFSDMRIVVEARREKNKTIREQIETRRKARAAKLKLELDKYPDAPPSLPNAPRNTKSSIKPAQPQNNLSKINEIPSNAAAERFWKHNKRNYKEANYDNLTAKEKVDNYLMWHTRLSDKERAKWNEEDHTFIQLRRLKLLSPPKTKRGGKYKRKSTRKSNKKL